MLRYKDAFTLDGFDYFPELGKEIPKKDREKGCKIAYENLFNAGYIHIDLYNDDNNLVWYNYTNARKFENSYYPIDMSKIIPRQTIPGGTRKPRKTRIVKKRQQSKKKSKKSK